jgi:hypothetical protein
LTNQAGIGGQFHRHQFRAYDCRRNIERLLPVEGENDRETLSRRQIPSLARKAQSPGHVCGDDNVEGYTAPVGRKGGAGGKLAARIVRKGSALPIADGDGAVRPARLGAQVSANTADQ